MTEPKKPRMFKGRLIISPGKPWTPPKDTFCTCGQKSGKNHTNKDDCRAWTGDHDEIVKCMQRQIRKEQFLRLGAEGRYSVLKVAALRVLSKLQEDQKTGLFRLADMVRILIEATK